MKILTTGTLFFLTLSMLPFGAQGASIGCEGKKAEVQLEIRQAKAHGNDRRVTGLEKALREIESNCTEAGLRAEREAKISEKKQEVAEREDEVVRAKETGNAKKIEKKMQKLKNAKEELIEAENDLNQY